MARADDPSVMTRNPALLADLWDDQAMLGAHLLLVDACFLPTGAYGWNPSGPDDVIQLRDEPPLYLQAAKNPISGQQDTYLNGDPLPIFANEPFPNVCYQGPAPFLPRVALSMKPTDDLGVGFGFFPPDSVSLYQWGNRDGTVDTPNGLRPNPLRYFRSHQNVSFFTLLGAVGYRLNDFVRVGLGLQWNLAVFEAITWTTPNLFRDYATNIRADVFGRDLFIPGVIASVDVKPIEALDIALGFKWSDRVRSKAKLDITTGAFGYGQPFTYIDATNGMTTVGTAVPVTVHNQGGDVDSPPIWVPQLSAGIRFADRLKPAFKDREKAHQFAKGVVEDSMQNERWDVELDGVYYFNSAYDHSQFTTTHGEVILRSVAPDGTIQDFKQPVGKCVHPDFNVAPGADTCPDKLRIVKTEFGGKDQISLRMGGDYNVLPGLFTVRAGVSYETDGQNAEMLNVLEYMLGRVGIHAGLTLRVAGKTDVSLGYAHFIQKRIRLQVNPESGLPGAYKTAEYNFKPGEGVADAMGNNANAGGFDGVAEVEVPNADGQRPLSMPGPHYINAGSYHFNLDVLSAAFTQHF